MLISTNTNNYGFTNCFTKLDNRFFVSSYSIDDASSNINVFQHESEISNPKSQVAYEYTLEGDSCAEGSCISTLSCSMNSTNNVLTVASGSSRTLKIWLVQYTSQNSSISNQRRAALLKMCKQTNFQAENNEDDDDESESEQEDEVYKPESNDSDSEETKKTSKCSIQ